MRITEVNDDRSKREFLEVPSFIYAEDPVWVRPLDQEIEAIFDPEMNNYHSHGSIARWLLKDDSGKLIGRVAARSEEHTSELQSLMRISYDVFCLKQKNKHI